MGFSEIIGHSRQKETLRQALSNARLHHAYLFVGPQGVGKRTVALGLAKAIHCAQMTGDYCGHCTSCVPIEGGNHPDVRTIEPLAGKKEISIQQIREIERQLNLSSFAGGRKIAILKPATLMNLAAQNALLKTLEEPPQDSLLILIATNTGGLLPTLRSRCLRLAFGPVPRELLAGYLTSTKGMRREEAESLSALALGSVGAAMTLDGREFRQKRESWLKWLSLLKEGDYRAATAAAEALANSREESLAFLQWAESWYRDLMVQAVKPEPTDLVNLDMRERIEAESARVKLKAILSLTGQLSEAAAGIQRNLNRRMVLESLFFHAVGNR